MRRAVALAGTTLLFAMLFVTAALAQETPSPSEDVKLPPERNPGEEVIQRRPGQSEPLQFFPPPVDPRQVPAPAAVAPRDQGRPSVEIGHAGHPSAPSRSFELAVAGKVRLLLGRHSAAEPNGIRRVLLNRRCCPGYRDNIQLAAPAGATSD